MAARTLLQLQPPSVGVELVDWWRGELRGLFRRNPASTSDSEVEIEPDVTIAREGVHIGSEAGFVPLADLVGRAPLKAGKPANIRLLSNRAIKRRLADHRIPLARAYRMAELDVSANTPFDLSAVYIIFCAPPSEGKATEYFLVRRDIIDPVLEWLRASKRKIGSLSIAGGGALHLAQGYVVDHLNGSKGLFRSINRHGTALAFVLLAGAMFYNILSSIESSARSVDAQIEALEPSADKARSALKSRSEQLGRLQALYRERENYPPLVRTLEELSTLLPDGSYLSTLSQQEEKIRISGFSSSAASLVAVIDSSALFKNPRFTSAVVKVPGRDGEQFNMEIEIEHAD